MRAIIYDKSNKPDLFTLQQVPKPIPTGDQVLVKIHAVSINAADYRSMSLGMVPKSRIFGADIAGEVEAVGDQVKSFKIGDRVFADILHAGFGGLAEYVAVSESYLASIPDAVSYTDAYSLPIAGLTALQALRDFNQAAPGKKVLIYGAAGGVGTFAVQIAKRFGAEVTAVCSTRNVELVRSLGADTVVDYTKEDALKNRNTYDLILAVNGKRALSSYLRCMVAGGHLVVLGGAFSQLIATMLFKGILSLGSKKISLLSAHANRPDLELLAGWVADGSVKPVIEKIVPLQDAPAAMHEFFRGHARGKLVVEIVEK